MSIGTFDRAELRWHQLDTYAHSIAVSVMDKDFGQNAEVTFRSSNPAFTVVRDLSNPQRGFLRAAQ